MRMRKKPNLEPRMERCAAVHTKNPMDKKGKWLDDENKYKELHLEIGCGKGRFTVGTARENEDALLVAIEKVADALVIAMERTVDEKLENVQYICGDATNLTDMFEQGEISRIYINFCDPWPKTRDAKRRLTSPNFLEIYTKVLKSDGEIHFKTDNSPLFEYSVKSFEKSGWILSEVTRDLHENGECGVMTDYETKFHNLGVKINRCVAVFGGNKE